MAPTFTVLMGGAIGGAKSLLEKSTTLRRDLGYTPPQRERIPLLILAVVLTLTVVAGIAVYSFKKRSRARRLAERPLSTTSSSDSDEDLEKNNAGIAASPAKIQLYSAWRKDRSRSVDGVEELVTEKGEAGEWERNNCVFCLEDIKDDDLVRGIDCVHVFHDSCASQWKPGKKQKVQRCPLCRIVYLSCNVPVV